MLQSLFPEIILTLYQVRLLLTGLRVQRTEDRLSTITEFHMIKALTLMLLSLVLSTPNLTQ
jgi:hypothetical protein